MAVINSSRSKASVDQLIRIISLPSVSSLSDMSSCSFPTSSDSSYVHQQIENPGEYADAFVAIGDSTANDVSNEILDSCDESLLLQPTPLVCDVLSEDLSSYPKVERVEPSVNIERNNKKQSRKVVRAKDKRPDVTAAVSGISFWPAYLALLDKENNVRNEPKDNKFNKILSDSIPSDVNKIFMSLKDRDVLNSTFNDRLNKLIRDEFEGIFNEKMAFQPEKVHNSKCNETDNVHISYPKTKLKSISLQFDPSNPRKDSVASRNKKYKFHVGKSFEARTDRDNYELDSNSSATDLSNKEFAESCARERALIRALHRLIKDYKNSKSESVKCRSCENCTKVDEKHTKKDEKCTKMDKKARKHKVKSGNDDDKYEVFNLTCSSAGRYKGLKESCDYNDNVDKNVEYIPQISSFGNSSSYDNKLSSDNLLSREDSSKKLPKAANNKHDNFIGCNDKTLLKGMVNSGIKYHILQLANAPIISCKPLLEKLHTCKLSPKLYLDIESYGSSGFGRAKLSSNAGIYKISLLSDNVDYLNTNNLARDNWMLATTKMLDKSFNGVSKNIGNDWMSRNYGFNYAGFNDLFKDNQSIDSGSSGGNNCVLASIQYQDALDKREGEIGLLKNKNLLNSFLAVLPSRSGETHDFISVPQVRAANGSNKSVERQMLKHGLILELAQKVTKNNKPGANDGDSYVHLVHPDTKQYLCLNMQTGHIQFRKIDFNSFNFTLSPRTGKSIEWIPACFKLLPLYKYTPRQQALEIPAFEGSGTLFKSNGDLTKYVAECSKPLGRGKLASNFSREISSAAPLERKLRDLGKPTKAGYHTGKDLTPIEQKQQIVLKDCRRNVVSEPKIIKSNSSIYGEQNSFIVESPKIEKIVPNRNKIDYDSKIEICDPKADSSDDEANKSGCCSFDNFGFFGKKTEKPIKIGLSVADPCETPQLATKSQNAPKQQVVNVTLKNVDDLTKFVNLVSGEYRGASGSPPPARGGAAKGATPRSRRSGTHCIEDLMPIRGVADITVSKLGVNRSKKRVSGDCFVKFSLTGDLPDLPVSSGSHMQPTRFPVLSSSHMKPTRTSAERIIRSRDKMC